MLQDSHYPVLFENFMEEFVECIYCFFKTLHLYIWIPNDSDRTKFILAFIIKLLYFWRRITATFPYFSIKTRELEDILIQKYDRFLLVERDKDYKSFKDLYTFPRWCLRIFVVSLVIDAGIQIWRRNFCSL